MLIKLSKDGFVNQCTICKKLAVYTFDVGGLTSKPGPFAGLSSTTLELRLDNEAGSVGRVEKFKFPDYGEQVPTADDVVAVLAKNKYISARVAYDGVVIESKTTGKTSCVEPIGGTARKVLGFDEHGPDYVRMTCGRPVLGYFDVFSKQMFTNSILLRGCTCGGHETLLIQPANHEPNNRNIMTNTLGQWMFDNSWIDHDMIDKLKALPFEHSGSIDQFPEVAVKYDPETDSISPDQSS